MRIRTCMYCMYVDIVEFVRAYITLLNEMLQLVVKNVIYVYIRTYVRYKPAASSMLHASYPSQHAFDTHVAHIAQHQ